MKYLTNTKETLMEIEKFIRRILTPLTEEEKLQSGAELAELNINIEGKMDLKRILPKQIESLQEEAAEIAHYLKIGSKAIDVECFFVNDDPELGKRQMYRLDTSEKVGEPEDMPDPELFNAQEPADNQAEIPFNTYEVQEDK